MHRPELLVLDEPTGGLDPLLQGEFRALLRETAADGRTVFLSSHSLDEVQHAADRVGIIRDGQLLDVRRRRGAPRARTSPHHHRLCR
jgi:ABC-2 type transport system ATP-binding protein